MVSLVTFEPAFGKFLREDWAPPTTSIVIGTTGSSVL